MALTFLWIFLVLAALVAGAVAAKKFEHLWLAVVFVLGAILALYGIQAK